MDELNSDVYLDNEPLNAISPHIRVITIEEQPATRTIQTVAGGRIGSHVLRDQVTSISVRIQFVILESNYERRKAICGMISKWARNGRRLQIADRSSQELRVCCTALPKISDTRDWGKVLSMTFTAYETPWWENTVPWIVRSATAGTEHHAYLRFGADHPESQLDVVVTAVAAVDSLTVSVCDDRMAFSGLGMAAGDQLHIVHEDGLLVAYVLSGAKRRPCLSCRSAESSDDLMVCEGKNNPILLTADAAVTAAFSTRGRYD